MCSQVEWFQQHGTLMNGLISVLARYIQYCVRLQHAKACRIIFASAKRELHVILANVQVIADGSSQDFIRLSHYFRNFYVFVRH